MKKIISLCLILTMCISMLAFVGVSAEGTVIFSQSFEEDGITLKPWATKGKDLNSIVSEKATDGKKALLVNDDSDTLAGGVVFDGIAVTAGATYEATVDAYLELGKVDFFLRFYGEDKKQITNNSAKPVEGEQKTLKITAVAPSGAVTAALLVASYGGTAGKAYFDNFKLSTSSKVVSNPVLDAKDGVVFYENFDNGLDSWTFFNEYSQSNMKLDSTTNDGSKYSLYAVDDSDKVTPNLKSPMFNVTPGATYTFTVDSKIVEGESMRVYCKFFDANGKQLESKSFGGGKPHDWKTSKLEMVAPEGAVTGQAWICGGNNILGSGYFDNLKVTTDAKTGSETPAQTETKLDKINKSSIVLFIGSPNALVNGNKTLIDTANDKVIADTVNGRTLVPVRFIAENYGAQVGWDDPTQTVTLKMADKTVTIVLNKNEIDINGQKITIDVPAQTIQDRTMLPLRAFVESVMGKTIFWDDRGLIVITDEAMLDATADADTINTIINNVK